MIISHEHRFIYIKARKVAGTSVMVALANRCGKNDVISNICRPSSKIDESQHRISRRNCSLTYTHVLPETIRGLVTAKQWRNYLKICVVRNPWDYYVSRFFHVKRRKNKNIKFKNFLEKTIKFNNEVFYFSKNGSVVPDFFMRFEHLEADYRVLCERLGIPCKLPLPKLKTKIKPEPVSYRKFYQPRQQQMVAESNARTIELFGYSF